MGWCSQVSIIIITMVSKTEARGHRVYMQGVCRHICRAYSSLQPIMILKILDCNRPKTWAAAQVLKRINAEIEGRRRAGEDLPPPPKTAIAGPEYFGLNQPEVGNNLQPHTKAQNCLIETLRLLLF